MNLIVLSFMLCFPTAWGENSNNGAAFILCEVVHETRVANFKTSELLTGKMTDDILHQTKCCIILFFKFQIKLT